MATRNEYGSWTKEGIELEQEITEILSPMFKKSLELGFTIEDFVYMVHYGAQEITMGYVMANRVPLKERLNNKGK